MGATVVIAEIDVQKGEAAAARINAEFPETKAEFCQIDLSQETEIRGLYAHLMEKYGFVDVLFHNAAMVAMGNVEEVPVSLWDKSYRVNLKAPLLLTQLFLPLMKRRRTGVIVFVPSSGAAPYMGAYEVFKTSQVELCSTLAGELENSGVYTYAIGPRLVKTETAVGQIEIVAAKMGLSLKDFYAMNESHILTAEEAGCGFAVSVLEARKYHGQEIGSIQALLSAGLCAETALDSAPREELVPLLEKMLRVYEEQYAGWMERNIFERQWVLRDFKKTVGMPAEQFLKDMRFLKEQLDHKKLEGCSKYREHFEKLAVYFEHQHQLLQGFEKNPQTLRENSDILLDWVRTLKDITSKL